jgi:hypothetical protein
MQVNLPNQVVVRVDGNNAYMGPPAGVNATAAAGKGRFAIGNDTEQGLFVYKFDDAVVVAK